MSPASALPVAVLLPLGSATILLAVDHWLPPLAGKLVAIATALLVSLLCAWLAHEALAGSILHWFGGWYPAASGRPGVVLGISFMADPASAALASFCGLLFGASLVFAWGFFDEAKSHFQILMLLFLAAMVGFCLTHDLFNLFVWFELMSVAAYALTASPLGGSALEGAFNFTVVNSLASFLMLAGIGLLYARTATLDFTALGEAIARLGPDTVVTAGFVLVAVALLTKAAILPFHFWLSDAHTVAPSPVSVVFSGAMVGLGLFGLTKLLAEVFGGDLAVTGLVRAGLLPLGAATAIVGSLMAWAQRHLKRLLAFSTIAHLGIMLTGLATLTPTGTAGLLAYIVTHGLVKASLFMVAGILLALRASADEIVLYGQGRDLWPAGIAMAAAGLLLGGLPLGLLHGATHLIETSQEAGWVRAAIVLSTGLTGAAVLRAALRIFLRASGAPGVEAAAPTEREREKADRPLWLMLMPCGALLALALTPFAWVEPFLTEAASAVAGARPAFGEPETPALALAPIAIALAIVALSLFRRRPTGRSARRLARLERALFDPLQHLHSGIVGDYAAWMALGLAAFATLGWLLAK